ncbi:uncharacterized protein LOC128031889 [Gossypium raimondii]|uniref:Uncharacterized protein n=1 Tax=Gossypium raimondii TaxID=29730 RepID=A0A0D2U3E3_GOSRA|nr:uncharacterized protein LOC128031889 [Gossypium raimondii]KJB82233.1 hypothetical protein B456_013G183400 [Gossypium raimondii]
MGKNKPSLDACSLQPSADSNNVYTLVTNTKSRENHRLPVPDDSILSLLAIFIDESTRDGPEPEDAHSVLYFKASDLLDGHGHGHGHGVSLDDQSDEITSRLATSIDYSDVASPTTLKEIPQLSHDDSILAMLDIFTEDSTKLIVGEKREDGPLLVSLGDEKDDEIFSLLQNFI